MDNKQKYLLIIAGPTGVGKTDVAVDLGKKLNTSIISADSRQIFKELSIGTAVPSKKQLEEVEHYMIQTYSIFDNYNAYKYEIEVIKLLEKIFNYNDIVIMAGGSGMYIDAVLYGIDDIPSVNPEIRNNLLKRLNVEGLESLSHQLKDLDPYSYDSIDIKNSKRVLKALEITLQTGKPYSGYLTGEKKNRKFKPVLVALDIDREQLHDRINKRVDKMIDKGLVKEAEYAHGIWKKNKIPSLNTVGYKEFYPYFEGEYSFEEAVEFVKRNSRRYARRQITWLRKYDDIKWFSPGDKEGIYRYLNKQMTKA